MVRWSVTNSATVLIPRLVQTSTSAAMIRWSTGLRGSSRTNSPSIFR
jgi:hypothetical protein